MTTQLPNELRELLVVKAKIADVHCTFTAPEELVLKVYNEKGLEEAKKFLDELKHHLIATLENSGLNNDQDEN